MTHALLWNQIANTLEVVTVEAMLSSNRIAYTEDVAAFAVPIAMGPLAEMRDAAIACIGTLKHRGPAMVHARPRLVQELKYSSRRIGVAEEVTP